MLHHKKDRRSYWVLWLTVGTRRDWNAVIAKTRSLRINGEKNSSSLSALGRSKVQVCDIRACYSILCTTHTWDLNLFLDTQWGWDDPRWGNRQEPLDASCQQREVTVNIATRSQLSKNHYSIIWLMRRCCCHNTYISLVRWKTNRRNLFLQIKYWSAVLYRASGVCLKNERTRALWYRYSLLAAFTLLSFDMRLIAAR